MGAPMVGPLTFMWQIWTEFPVTGRCKHLGTQPHSLKYAKKKKQANKNPQTSTSLCETYYYAHKQQPITITKML